MTKKLHVIYIPGLGDKNPENQRKAVKTWRWYGVTAELFHMKWYDSEPWETKFAKLFKRIDVVAAGGQKIGLVGASAGASAVLNAYAARKDKIAGVVLISGKVLRPKAIDKSYIQSSPAFVTSVYACQESLEQLDNHDREHILSRYALFDEVVLTKDSKILGAHNRRVPTIGHVITIATQLFFGAPSFLRFLKKQ